MFTCQVQRDNTRIVPGGSNRSAAPVGRPEKHTGIRNDHNSTSKLLSLCSFDLRVRGSSVAGLSLCFFDALLQQSSRLL